MNIPFSSIIDNSLSALGGAFVTAIGIFLRDQFFPSEEKQAEQLFADFIVKYHEHFKNNRKLLFIADDKKGIRLAEVLVASQKFIRVDDKSVIAYTIPEIQTVTIPWGGQSE